jgi:hypothetical protein
MMDTPAQLYLRPEKPAMRRIVDIVTQGIYALAGSFYLLLGIVVLLLGTGILPTWIHDRIFEIGQNNPFTMHLIQETGTLWVLVGMLFFWFARHLGFGPDFLR